MAWGWSSGLGRTGSGRCAQIRLETGGDACFGRGDAFVAVSGGEKVHHGNLVELKGFEPSASALRTLRSPN